MTPSTMICLQRTSSLSRPRRSWATGPKITWASKQPYSVVIMAVPMLVPRESAPPSPLRFMDISMLIRPTSVPTMPKAGATLDALSYSAAASSCRADMHSMSFSKMPRTLSWSLASTMSMMACLKKGSVCSLAFSSRDKRPFLRAIWASSTSWSMYPLGSNILLFKMILKCLGMALSMDPGKLATTMKIVHPMVMKIEAASKKFQRLASSNVIGGFPAALGPMLMPMTQPSKNTPNAPTMPMI